jgi:2-oxoglutarate dehydrogenase E1 component
MWCYRRFGHNEGDEPGFTQPLMYQKIRAHPPVSKLYADRLASRRRDRRQFAGEGRNPFRRQLEQEFEAAKSYKANHADWFGGRWSGLHKPADPETARRNVPTGIEAKLFDSLGRTLTTVPDTIQIHKTLAACSMPSVKCSPAATGFDWATGEALAFGSLLVRRLWRAPVGSGFGPRHLQPAPLGLGRPDRRAQIRAAAHRAPRPVRGA